MAYYSKNNSVATVNPETGEVTAKTAGTVVIGATAAASDQYDEQTVEYTLTVEKAEQTVTFGASNINEITYKPTGTYPYRADAKTRVTYTIISGTDVATIDASTGELTTLKAGEATIKATAAETNQYKENSATFTVTVEKATQTVTFGASNAASIPYKPTGTYQYTAEGKTDIIYAITAGTEFATIDADSGALTTLKSGNVTITATAIETDQYKSDTEIFNLTVELAEQTSPLVFQNGTENQVVIYGNAYSNPIISGGNTNSITYHGNNDDVATVNPTTGEVTAKAAGTVVITATAAESDQYKAQTVKYTLTVEKAPQTVTFGASNVNEITYKPTGTYKYTADTKTTVTYTIISGTSVATIDASTGELTTLKSGEVTIKATAAETNQYKENSATFTVTVEKAEQTVTFDASNISSIVFKPTGTYQYTAEAKTDITYRITSGTSVASVDINTGALTTLKSGTATITATAAETDQYKTNSANFTVTIEKAEQTVTFLASNASSVPYKPAAEGTYQYTAEAKTDIMYTIVSGTDIATIEASTGKLTTLKKGNVTIKATAAETDQYKTASATYDLTVVLAEQTSLLVFRNGTVNQSVIYGSAYSNPIVSGGNTSNITYAITSVTPDPQSELDDDKKVATVDANTGEVTAIAAGTVVITATAAESDQYKTQKVSYTLTVKRATQSVTFDASNADVITYKPAADGTYQYTAGAKTAITYKINSGTDVASIEANNGALTTLKSGIAVIKATAAKTPQYEEAFQTFNVTVERANQTIGFEQTAYDMTNGDNAFVAPTIPNPASGVAVDKSGYGTGKVTYTISTNNVASEIDENTGALTFTNNIGSVTVTATKEQDDRYNHAVASYTLNVKDWIPADTYITTTGNKLNISEWFTGNVNIDANDGYSVSYERTVGNQKTVWSDVLTNAVEDDGEHTIKYYVRENETGYISGEQAVIIKKDTKAPAASVKNDDGIFADWNKHLSIVPTSHTANTVNFSIVSNDDNGEVATSGIAKREYYVDIGAIEIKESSTFASDVWTEYDETSGIPVEHGKRFVVYVKVTDVAGNVTYANTNIVIFDTLVVPTVTGVIETEGVVVDGGIKLYNGNVEVKVFVSDAAPSSGIKRITYKVFNEDRETQSGEIFNFNVNNPELIDLKTTLSDLLVTVDATKNNSDDVRVEITVEDNAGNVHSADAAVEVASFRIDITKPKIEIDYDINNANIYGDRGYFRSNRVARIVITERESSFVADEATKGISVKIVDGKIDTERAIVRSAGWKKISADSVTGDGAQFEYTIEFVADANYIFEVSYKDLAGNENAPVTFGQGDVATKEFTIDRISPSASITIEKQTWSNLVSKLTYSIFKKNELKVSVSAYDNISPISVSYYKTNDPKIKTSNELNAIISWKPYTE